MSVWHRSPSDVWCASFFLTSFAASSSSHAHTYCGVLELGCCLLLLCWVACLFLLCGFCNAGVVLALDQCRVNGRSSLPAACMYMRVWQLDSFGVICGQQSVTQCHARSVLDSWIDTCITQSQPTSSRSSSDLLCKSAFHPPGLPDADLATDVVGG